MKRYRINFAAWGPGNYRGTWTRPAYAWGDHDEPWDTSDWRIAEAIARHNGMVVANVRLDSKNGTERIYELTIGRPWDGGVNIEHRLWFSYSA